jgi:hypothetical protein
MAREYREKIETELRDICNDVLVRKSLWICLSFTGAFTGPLVHFRNWLLHRLELVI